MNRLRRMVLVNSANVRYREVELDGHIHFIGTQGTGKSTLLRAILFFYTADSQRLGISKEKKSFADYYFPFADSYVFYEVQAGARRFCVWLYKRQNRLCFRFMDGGYDRDMAIDGSRARGEDEVRARAEELGVKVERAIHNFTEYRDVLYGENRAMRRYALMQGVSNYSTIPRTISNIFLNANLDGGYIKKTIIDSLSEEEMKINLEANRHHLDTARSHYADVQEYLAQEAQAEQIVALYESVQAMEECQRETAWKIGAACNRAREQQRVLKEQIAAKYEEEQGQRARIKALEEKADTEKRRLHDRLAEVKKDIARCNELSRHYEALGIGALLKEIEARPELEQALNLCTEQRQVLTAKAEQQEAQFGIALQRLEYECLGRIQQIHSKLGVFKDRIRAEQDALRTQVEEQKKLQETEFAEGCGGLQNERSTTKAELDALELELRKQDHVPLFAEERKRLEESARELGMKKIRLEEEQKRNKADIEAQQREAEGQQKIERLEGEHRLRPLVDERERLKAMLASRNAELEQLAGSLVEFLDREVDGWHDTIGKTVRRDVLLHPGLEPRKTDGRSLFGIALKLEHLEADELSKTGLEKAVAETQQALAELAVKIEGQRDANQAAQDRLLQKFNRAVKELQDAGKALSAGLFACERDVERNAIAMRELAEKTAAKRAEMQAEVEAKIHAVRTRMQELDALIDDLTQKHEAAKARIADAFDRRMRQLEKEQKLQEETSAAAVLAQEKRMETQRAELNAERTAILEKEGIDAKKVAALDERIQETRRRLEEIRRNETVRIEYAKDRREWIDRLPEFQGLRAQLEQKLAHQSELFDHRIRNERITLEELSAALKTLGDERRTADAEVGAFEAFEREELFETFESFIRHHDAGEKMDCMERIGALKDLAWKFEKQFKLLTERITAFSGRFSEGNCLGFDVHLSGEPSFRNFAQALAEFVREQRIVTLKTEVTKKYSMVLNAIVTETTRLLQREGEVNRVIQRINGDFSASNFVGVVHSIELRMLESSNRVFQVLREICRFQAENHMNFGEIDLFNRGNSGNDEKAVELLDQLRNQMSQTKNTTLSLEDALDLEFRVRENENDTNWVNRLANIGSNGTDVLVKSMIYINLLNIFKTGTQKQSVPAQLHCLVDEVGILHDSNVRSLIEFAAERGICMINGSPNSHNEQDYRHIYIFRKEKNETAITKLISHAS